MKGGGKALGRASEVSCKAATHCHSPEEPPVPTGMQEGGGGILTAFVTFFCVCVTLPSWETLKDNICQAEVEHTDSCI